MITFLSVILALIIGATLGRNSLLKRMTIDEKVKLLKRTNELTEPFVLIKFNVVHK